MKQISFFLNIDKQVKNPRYEMIDFFSEQINRSKRFIAIRLSRYDTNDLFYIKSEFNDIKHRRGIVAATKYFWWTTKTTKK